jgi:hypothetical protein
MIHEILKILDTSDLQELEKQRITNDLLRLFNVVGRSELLLDFIQWRKQVAVDDLTEKEIVEFYLSRKIK